MRVVYIAGPFRGTSQWHVAENIRAAERLALEVWKLGAACICPHANTAHFDGVLPDSVWLDGDIALLQRCDAVMMTPDWKRSRGATAEHDYAVRTGKPVFYDLGSLEAWLAPLPNSLESLVDRF